MTDTERGVTPRTEAGRRLDAALEEAHGPNADASRAILAIEREASACQTRIVIRNDNGRVVVHNHSEDEEPESAEIPAWAVRAIFAEAGKDPDEEAAKIEAGITRLMAMRREGAPVAPLLDVERLARAVHNAQCACEHPESYAAGHDRAAVIVAEYRRLSESDVVPDFEEES